MKKKNQPTEKNNSEKPAVSSEELLKGYVPFWGRI